MRTDEDLRFLIRDLIAYSKSSYGCIMFHKEIHLIFEALRIYRDFGY